MAREGKEGGGGGVGGGCRLKSAGPVAEEGGYVVLQGHLQPAKELFTV